MCIVQLFVAAVVLRFFVYCCADKMPSIDLFYCCSLSATCGLDIVTEEKRRLLNRCR